MMRVAQLLIEKIRRDYPNDVSLVHIHGSYAYQDTHERSDLDLYFVPKTQRGCRLGCTFILNGIGCDLWPLSWERLERIARHEERISSIITEGKVLYYGGEDDKIRFEALKQTAIRLAQDQEAAARRAAEKLEPAYQVWFRMERAGTLSAVRMDSIDMIYILSYALAELNGTPIKRGRRLLKQELLDMPLLPRDFERLYDTLFTNAGRPAIQAACGALLHNTEQLIKSRQKEVRPTIPFRQALEGWYEEMIQSYNKIYHACETGDIYTPLFAAAEFSGELAEICESTGITPDLPDMAGAYDPENLEQIAQAARRHQALFEKLLQENGVPIRRFESFEQAEAFLATL